jgi:hypothetical protein
MLHQHHVPGSSPDSGKLHGFPRTGIATMLRRESEGAAAAI